MSFHSHGMSRLRKLSPTQEGISLPEGPPAAEGAPGPDFADIAMELTVLNFRMAATWSDEAALLDCFTDVYMFLAELPVSLIGMVAEEPGSSLLVTKAAEAMLQFPDNPKLLQMACFPPLWFVFAEPGRCNPRIRGAAFAAGLSRALVSTLETRPELVYPRRCAIVWLNALAELCRGGVGPGAANDAEQFKQAREQLCSVAEATLRAALLEQEVADTSGELVARLALQALCSVLRHEAGQAFGLETPVRDACRQAGGLLEGVVCAADAFSTNAALVPPACYFVSVVAEGSPEAAGRARVAGLLPVAFGVLERHRTDPDAVQTALNVLFNCLYDDQQDRWTEAAEIDGSVEAVTAVLRDAVKAAGAAGWRNEKQFANVASTACGVLLHLCVFNAQARARAGAAGAVEAVAACLKQAEGQGPQFVVHACGAIRVLILRDENNRRRALAAGALPALAAIAAATDHALAKEKAEIAIAALQQVQEQEEEEDDPPEQIEAAPAVLSGRRGAVAKKLQERLRQKAAAGAALQSAGGAGDSNARRRQQAASDEAEERERRERLAAELLAEEEMEKAAKAEPTSGKKKPAKRRGKAAVAAAVAAAAAAAPAADELPLGSATAPPRSSPGAQQQPTPAAEEDARLDQTPASVRAHSAPVADPPGEQSAPQGGERARGEDPVAAAAAEKLEATAAQPPPPPSTSPPQPSPAAAASEPPRPPPAQAAALPPWLSPQQPARPEPEASRSGSGDSPQPASPAFLGIPRCLLPPAAAATGGGEDTPPAAAAGLAPVSPQPARLGPPRPYQPPSGVTQTPPDAPSEWGGASSSGGAAALPPFLVAGAPQHIVSPSSAAASPAAVGRSAAALAEYDENECSVCLDAHRTHAMVPCGHVCACAQW